MKTLSKAENKKEKPKKNFIQLRNLLIKIFLNGTAVILFIAGGIILFMGVGGIAFGDYDWPQLAPPGYMVLLLIGGGISGLGKILWNFSEKLRGTYKNH